MTEYNGNIVSGMFRGTRMLAVLVLALGTIYGALWTLELAPITNGQAKGIMLEVSNAEAQKVWTRLNEYKEEMKSIQQSLNEVERLGTRIEESQRRSEDIQNKILDKLLNR